MIQKTKEKIKRTFQGEVVSDRPDKTIVVRVDHITLHPKYQKRFKVSKRYKVHDPNNQYKIGDKVVFVECRPISKEKKWHVLKK